MCTIVIDFDKVSGPCRLICTFVNSDGSHYNFWVLKLDSNGDIPGCELIENSVLSVNTPSVSVQDTNITPQQTTATVTDVVDITTLNFSSEISSHSSFVGCASPE